MSYKKNIISNFLNQINIIILNFVISIIVARNLGPHDKGYIGYLILIFSTIGNYGHLGISNAATYFQKKSKYNEQEVYSTNTTYLFSISIVIASCILFLKTGEIALSGYNGYLIILAITYMITIILITNLTAFFIGNERIIEINKYNITCQVIQSALVMLIVSIKWLNVYSYFLILTLTQIIYLIYMCKNIRLNYEFKINKSILSGEFKFGIIIFLSSAFSYLNYRADQFMIKSMIGINDLGIYSIGVSLAELAFLIPNSISSAFLGKLYNLKDTSRVVTSFTIKYTFYSCLIICSIGILMTPLIPIVYGEAFERAVTVTKILFLGISFASIGKVSCSYIESQGKPKVHLFITFISLIVNIATNIFFIPKYGINGAAMASLISYMIYGILYIAFFLYFEKFRFNDLFVFDNADIKMMNNLVFKITHRRDKISGEL